MSASLAILANNGDIGGGEVMLLALAEAARGAGYDVTVVAPRSPDAVLRAAVGGGFAVVAVHGEGRKGYLRNLRRWARRGPTDLLWCNGLVPALATAGLARRVVHLHLAPSGLQRLAARIATLGALRVLVPSAHLAAALPGATVFPNWTRIVPATGHDVTFGDEVVLGFLGRVFLGKGVGVLAEAVTLLNAASPDRRYRLLLSGEARFTDAAERAATEAALRPVADVLDRTGWSPPEQFFSSVDLAVFPSLVPETFGLVVAEAMAAGCPFVISDAGALAEVAGPDHRFVAPAGDPAALARTIEAAVAEYRPSDVARARDRWSELYSTDAGARRVAHVLGELLDGAAGAGTRAARSDRLDGGRPTDVTVEPEAGEQ